MEKAGDLWRPSDSDLEMLKEAGTFPNDYRVHCLPSSVQHIECWTVSHLELPVGSDRPRMRLRGCLTHGITGCHHPCKISNADFYFYFYTRDIHAGTVQRHMWTGQDLHRTGKTTCSHGQTLLVETSPWKFVFWHGNPNVMYLLKWYRQRLPLQGSNLLFRTQIGKVTFDTEIKYQESDKTRKKKTPYAYKLDKHRWTINFYTAFPSVSSHLPLPELLRISWHPSPQTVLSLGMVINFQEIL